MRKWLLAVALITATTGNWSAAQNQASTTPAQVQALYGVIIPEINFDAGITVDDAIDYLNSSVPGLQIAVVRAPGVPAGVPKLPKIHAKDISVEQLLTLITRTSPDFNPIEPLVGRTSVIFTLSIRAPDPVIGANGINYANVMRAPVVDVFQLRPAVEKLAELRAAKDEPRDVSERAAMADILSVLTTAMQELDDSPAKLQVHDATRSLIFKGSPEQREVVVKALATLVPPPPTDSERQIELLKERLSLATREAEDYRTRMMDADDRLREQAWEQKRAVFGENHPAVRATTRP